MIWIGWIYENSQCSDRLLVSMRCAFLFITDDQYIKSMLLVLKGYKSWMSSVNPVTS